MVISRTPFRISFFGGGTDYPVWYRRNGGAVLATTIDKYCYLTCRFLPPFFEHRFRIVWSKIENRQSVADISHPAVRAILTHLNVEQGVEIHHDGDLPARSGTGSSSSFAVGLLHGLHALYDRAVTKEKLAEEALYVEQELMGDPVGSQDQVMAAYGGFNHVRFDESGGIVVRPAAVRPERVAELERHLMLFFTGAQRTSAALAREYVAAADKKSDALIRMHTLVDEALEVLRGRSEIAAFGELLHESWQLKRSLGAHISNGEVDAMYAEARRLGAIGGKLSGAGGGGFMLLFVPPERQEAIRERFSHVVHVPIRFESDGSRIIFYDREEDFAQLDQRRRTHPVQAFRDMDAISRVAEGGR